MAKSLKVERLRGLDINVTPNIRTVDTYAPPAAADTRNNRGTQLVNFISQLSPQLQEYKKKHDAATEELQLRQITDMQFENKDGTFKSLEQLRESGEFHASNPTVAYAFNKSLGMEIGDKVRASVLDRYNQGVKDGSILRLTSEQTQQWVEQTTQQVASEYKEYTSGMGVMAGIKASTKELEGSLISNQASRAEAHAEDMMNHAFNVQVSNALTGVDMTDAGALERALSTLGESLYATDSSLTGTEVNKKMTNALKARIAVTQDPAELTAIIEASRNIKAGSGTLGGTSYWTELGLDTVINDAIERSDRLATANQSRKNRVESAASEQLQEQVIAHIQGGGTAEDFDYPLDSILNPAQQSRIYAATANALTVTEPMTSEEYVEVYNYFSKLTPPQATSEYQKIMNGTHSQFKNLSIADLNVIAGIKNVAPKNGTELYSDPFYKGLEKKTAEGYGAWDVLSRDIKVFSEDENARIWDEASVLLKEKWLEVVADTSAIEQYLPEHTSKVEQAGGTVNLQTILNTPALNRKLKDAMYNSVIQRIEPGDLSEAANTQGAGNQTEVLDGNGNNKTIKFTPGGD